MKLPSTQIKLTCKICQHETSHYPIATGQIKGSETDLNNGEIEYKTYKVIQCDLCKETTYCVDTRIHPGPGIGDVYIEKTSYFPPSPKRLKPKWFDQLPEKYKSILSEVYFAIDHDLLFLASSGTRTAIDQLIVEKIGDIGGFKQKIKHLLQTGIIDQEQKILFEALIDAGSASAHRSYKPDDNNIEIMMDILEDIFQKLIIEPKRKEDLKQKALDLQTSTPKRK
ncbi:MAG: DUF4145 domain-containing protein [Desulfotalea sp.]